MDGYTSLYPANPKLQFSTGSRVTNKTFTVLKGLIWHAHQNTCCYVDMFSVNLPTFASSNEPKGVLNMYRSLHI